MIVGESRANGYRDITRAGSRESSATPLRRFRPTTWACCGSRSISCAWAPRGLSLALAIQVPADDGAGVSPLVRRHRACSTHGDRDSALGSRTCRPGPPRQPGCATPRAWPTHCCRLTPTAPSERASRPRCQGSAAAVVRRAPRRASSPPRRARASRLRRWRVQARRPMVPVSVPSDVSNRPRTVPKFVNFRFGRLSQERTIQPISRAFAHLRWSGSIPRCSTIGGVRGGPQSAPLVDTGGRNFRHLSNLVTAFAGCERAAATPGNRSTLPDARIPSRFNRWPGSGARLPIFPCEARYPRKLGNVACDQRELASNHDCGDLKVVRANSLPSAFQIVPNHCIFVRGSVIEWKAHQGRQEQLNTLLLLGWILTSRGDIQQLRADDCANCHVSRLEKPKSRHDRGRLASKACNASVRVEEVRHGSSCSRDARDGCGARSKLESWIDPSTASNQPSGQPAPVSSRMVSSTQ